MDHLVGTVLARGSLPECVIVIPWRKLPGDNISFTDVLSYSTIFALPAHCPAHKFSHHRPWHSRNADIFCEHNATRHDSAPEGMAFFDAGRNPPLIMLELALTPVENSNENMYSRLLRLVIPGRTLMVHVTPCGATSSGPGGMRVVPWCVWGDDIRIWNGEGCEVRVYGSRLLCWESAADWQTHKLVIYEFDSPESMVHDIRSGDKTRLNEIIVRPSPSIFPLFFREHLRERMVTNAPYRRLETNIEGPGCNKCLLFGENCLVTMEAMIGR